MGLESSWGTTMAGCVSFLATGEETSLVHAGELIMGESRLVADGRGVFVDGGYLTRGRLRKGMLYVSFPKESVCAAQQLNQWDTHPVPSRTASVSRSPPIFYDGNAWMIEDF